MSRLFIFRIADVLRKRHPPILLLNDSLTKHTRSPLRLLSPILLVNTAMVFALDELPEHIVATNLNGIYILLVTSVAWLFISLTTVLQDVF